MEIIIATEKHSLLLRQLMIKTWRDTYLQYIIERGKKLIAEEIETLFSLKKIQSYFSDENHKIWMVKNDEDVAIGYAHLILFKGKKSAFLHQIYIVKEEQGKGIGQLLLNKCYQLMAMKNLLSIELEVDSQNVNAIHFYQKQGFEIINKVPYVNENVFTGYDNFVMKKSIPHFSLSIWKNNDKKLVSTNRMCPCIIL